MRCRLAFTDPAPEPRNLIVTSWLCLVLRWSGGRVHNEKSFKQPAKDRPAPTVNSWLGFGSSASPIQVFSLPFKLIAWGVSLAYPKSCLQKEIWLCWWAWWCMPTTPPFGRQRHKGGCKFMASWFTEFRGTEWDHVQKGRQANGEKSTIKPGINSFVLEWEQAKEIPRLENISWGFETVSRTWELVPQEKGTSNTAGWKRLVRGSMHSRDRSVEEAHFYTVIQNAFNRILQHCRQRPFSFGACEMMTKTFSQGCLYAGRDFRVF